MACHHNMLLSNMSYTLKVVYGMSPQYVTLKHVLHIEGSIRHVTTIFSHMFYTLKVVYGMLPQYPQHVPHIEGIVYGMLPQYSQTCPTH